MNGYELSRLWFDFCFENPEKIKPNLILSYKISPNKDYSRGGFYMIINRVTKMIYIGKSIDYMARLKQHLYLSSNKTLIDKELNYNPDLFDFYLLAKYEDIGINFFNRKLETVIEHRFIGKANSLYPNGYNNTYYGHL